MAVLIVLFASQLSCKKKDNFSNKLYISEAKNSPLAVLTMDNGVGTMSLTAAMVYKTAEAVQTTFSILDSSYVKEFNRKNHTEFQSVPSSAITLSTTQANIGSNQVFSNPVTLSVKSWPGYIGGVQYVVPVKISEGSNGMGLVPGSDVVYIRVKQVAVSKAVLNGAFGVPEGGPLMGPAALGKPFNTVTIEGRIKYDNYFIVSGNWRSDVFYGYGCQIISSSDGSMNVRFPNAAFIGAVGKQNLKTWTHFALVIENSNVSFYINGDLMVQSPYPGLTEEGAYSLSGYAAGCGLNVDEFRVWRTARTRNQLKEYACEVNPKDPDLLAYWKFDDGSGTRVTDVSGHGHNLVSNASATPTWVPGVRCPE